ncbi:MAG TPA: serine/threonine-protein kinase, partial [Ktedonobacteraceae bacterium]|nr:serine/threonine-protein kinase [Ktedonobacteraceae bacterium]
MSTNRGQHLIGKEVGGCLLEQLIGYGGSSAVFLAQPHASDQKVAVKVFLPHSTMDVSTQKSFYRRFLREAQAASELEHPNILSIYSYGEHQGLPYIVMPYVPGGTLAEHVKERGQLTLREAQRYIQQIADALDYAHQQGCVHCDVKPANILLDQDGRVVLSDFGIVRFMQGAVLNAQQSLKSSEILMGTPEYASPEQALGEALDGRSDIYSLAVTLFFLLTGFPPFRSSTPIKILLMHVHDTPPKLSDMRGDVTARVDKVVEEALSKWPADRYQTAGEFSRALSEAIFTAAQTRNIDRVTLTSAALKTLAENRKELEQSLQPVVEVKPLPRKPFRITRSMAIVLVLGIVLLGSFTIGALFYTAASNHAYRPLTITPTSSANPDDLLSQHGMWPSGPNGSAFFFSPQKYYIVNKTAQSTAIAVYGNHVYTNFRLTVTCSEVRSSSDGVDVYGVVFRAKDDQSHYYIFGISPSGQYYFYRYNNGKYPT